MVGSLAAQYGKGQSMDVAELARWVTSPLTGIVQRINELPACPKRIHLRSATVGDYSVLPGGGWIPTTGGSGATSASAFGCAVFETLERYCGAIVDETKTMRGQAAGGCLYGEALPLFTDSQYGRKGWPYMRLTERSDIHWTEAISLRSGEPVKVPTPLVHVPYRFSNRDECIGPATSTGMAAGWGRVEARIRGYCEVCERDAFSIMWMNRLSGPRVVPDRKSALAAELGRLAGAGELVLVNISNDLGVPVIAAVLRSRLFGRRTVTVGAACDADAARACRKAALEAVSEYQRQQTWAEDPSRNEWRPAPDFSNVVDYEWHGLVYAFEEYQAHLEFVTESPLRQDVADVPSIRASGAELLAELLHRSERQLPEVAAVDLTTPEIAALGVHVTKVIAPEAVPLAPDHRFPFLAHRRLYETPVAMGLQDEPATASELNPMPHPFA